jgi:fructosamine-3-kinase
MLSPQDIHQLSKYFETPILNWQSISGGDISNSYKLQTKNYSVFLKTHSNKALLNAEYLGLLEIGKTKTIHTPRILHFGDLEHNSCLALEWIDSKPAHTKDYTKLGQQLAQLHQCSQEQFGFSISNFIGHLSQSNTYHSNWNDFYIEERLVPQLHLAKNKNLLDEKDFPSASKLKEKCNIYFQNITPSLLHGDLWSGNFFISKIGTPYIFDPSTYYGHSEIDIAMTKLFGGFDASFYKSYHELIPKDEFTDVRIELYQLYYLLVHLNMFGTSYYTSVKHIIQKYFQ